MCIGRLGNVFQDKYVFEYDPGFFTAGGAGDQDDTDAARKRVGQAGFLQPPLLAPQYSSTRASQMKTCKHVS